jgi:hypothetical protein
MGELSVPLPVRSVLNSVPVPTSGDPSGPNGTSYACQNKPYCGSQSNHFGRFCPLYVTNSLYRPIFNPSECIS